MSHFLNNLNPQQRQAVEIISGPLLVLAGAGSGKTRVITHRIAYMLDRGISPDAICAVTFTNKAAEEMRQRLAQMVGHRTAEKVTLSTFHALGLSILQIEARQDNKRGKFTVFDTGDQRTCLREIAQQLKLDRSLDLGSILERISAWKNAFIAPDTVPPSEDAYDQAAAIFYPRYQQQLMAYAAVDFDDLVCLPCLMMDRDPALRQRWARRYQYLLVDEFQDSNAAQLRLLHALAGEHRNLCVVGDDDQSIYGWRGAQVENILQFESHFPGAKVVFLECNYRSVGSILEVANLVIAQNPKRHKKQLIPTRDKGLPVRLVVAPHDDAEAAWVANTIRAQVDSGAYRPSEVAVLFRAAALARGLETELRAVGLPYRVLGGNAFYESKDVKDLLAYLRLCTNQADEISLRRVINTPPRGIGLRTIEKLGQWAEGNGQSFFQTLRQAGTVLGGPCAPATAITEFLDLLQRTRERFSDTRQLAAGLEQLVEELDLRGQITRGSLSPKACEMRLGRINALIQGLENYCRRVPKPTLLDYLNRLMLASVDADQPQELEERVTLSTLHGSKGLEFPLVVMIGLEEGLLPHQRTLNPHQNDLTTTDIAEERRLCYVGITRAMDQLILTRCAQRMIRGRPQPRTPSRFLDPIPADLLHSEDLSGEPEPEEVKQLLENLLAKLAT